MYTHLQEGASEKAEYILCRGEQVILYLCQYVWESPHVRIQMWLAKNGHAAVILSSHVHITHK